MFAILINEKGGEQKRLDFDKPEVTIGRVQGNDIILPKGNVSKRHSRIVLKDGKFIIVDLKSTNGTYVNGRKITSPLVVKSTDKIYIGDFIISIEEAGGAAQASGPSAAPAEEAAAPPAPPAASVGPGGPAGRPAPPPPPRPTRSSLPVPPAALRRPEPESAEQDSVEGVSDGDGEISKPTSDAASGPGAQPRSPSAPPREASPRPTPLAESARGGDLVREPAQPRPAPPDRPLEQPQQPHVPTPPRQSMAAGLAPMSLPAGAGVDRPVVAVDRISDKSTMAAPAEAPIRATAPMTAAPRASTIAAPAVGAPGQQRPSAPRPTAPPASAGAAPAARPRPAPRPTIAQQQIQTDDPRRRRHVDLLNQVVPKAIEQLGLQSLTAQHLAEPNFSARVENVVGDLVDKLTPLPMGIDTDTLTREAVAEIIGAGPLDDLLGDETVHEIAVTSHDRIYVDRGSGQVLSDRVFSSSAGVLRAIERLASRAGSRIEGTVTEMRLDGGALLQVALPPNARVPSLILRRARKAGGRLQDLVEQGVLSAPMSEFLELCMRERRNLVVSGYGRGVMLGALGGATAAGARVVTVEPVSELDLSATAAAWIGLIAPGADARAVIGHAVRLHPDHLLITDVRGPEALDVAAALCGGQGVVVGVDAASARDAIARIESLGRLSGESPPRKALREELAQGLHLSVHVGRTASGAYRVMEISEVTLAEEGGVELVPIFSFKPEGTDGHFVATGHSPAFAG
jgi:pilus assembly protein CpaF